MTSAVWDTTTSLPSNPTLDISAFSVFAEGLDHPEGVALRSRWNALCRR